jgi:hypothetical protein
MSDPVRVLQNAARASNSIGLWTHYYDRQIVNQRPDVLKRIEKTPRIEQFGSRELQLYKYSYLEALHLKGFCGGSASTSYWLTKESLLRLLEELGFEVAVGEDAQAHPNGPAMTLFAARRSRSS